MGQQLRSQILSTVLVVGAGVLLAVGFQNCNGFTSGVSSSSVAALAQAGAVFPASPFRTVAPNAGAHVLAATTTMPVSTVCATSGATAPALVASGNQSLDIARSANQNLKVTLLDASGAVKCEYSNPTQLDQLTTQHLLDLSNLGAECANLAQGTYQLVVVPSSQNNYSNSQLGFTSNLVMNSPFYVDLKKSAGNGQIIAVADTLKNGQQNWTMSYYFGTQNGTFQMPTEKPLLLYQAGAAQTVRAATSETPPPNPVQNCEQTSSDPLVVDLSDLYDHPGALDLTAPWKSIRFDILGQSVNGANGSEPSKMVSWFTPESAKGRYLVVLPDATGSVYSIDQLFGNDTSGPDGKFSDDGFAALAKWDLNGDGTIDSRDAVFQNLRFWSDLNGDGIAEPSELHTAAELGIDSLALAYDRHFSERDQYDNLIKFKSIVHTIDGRNHLMYDLWLQIR